MIDVPQKIGVSFAVEGAARDDIVRLNKVIADGFGSQVRFGGGGNSEPHVTVALGETGQEDVALVIALVDQVVRELEPFTMRFGPIGRETVTGRYVLADIVVDAAVLQWRHRLRERIAGHLSGLGRMTDEPHLTLAVVEDHHEAVDRILGAWDAQIADCRVTHVDVAYAGARGAKRERIQRFTLGGS